MAMRISAKQVVIGAGALFSYAFLLIPLAIVIGASFDDTTSVYFRFPPEHWSLRWYRELPAKYWHGLGLSCLIALAAAAASTLIGGLAALGIAKGSLGRSPLLETFFRMPLQVPFVVTGIVFLQFYYLLFDAWRVPLIGSYLGFVLAHLFFCIPYAAGAVGSVITGDLARIENAGRIAGATEWRVFRRLTLPALKPGLFSGFFYAFIVSFGDVPVSVFLSTGGAVPLPVEIFQTLQFDFDPAVLSISSIVVVLSAVFIVFVQRVIGLDLILPGARR
jgi:putative spermidine/putrescine transport system permease protein